MDFRQMPQGLFEKLITWFFLWGERKAARQHKRVASAR